MSTSDISDRYATPAFSALVPLSVSDPGIGLYNPEKKSEVNSSKTNAI
jgi:hypothetical protein